MKTRLFASCLILMAIFIAALFWRAKDSAHGGDGVESLQTAGTDPPVTNRTQAARPRHSLSLLEQAINRRKAITAARDQFRTPIEFFGRVIDEKGNPVSEAQVQMMWTDLNGG
jgi:hypothetical protein